MVPIFKKGSKKDKESGNYRPVSLTSHICKILEKIIKEEIVKYLEENELIRDSQHGFRSRRSCLTNLLEFTENMLENKDDQVAVDILFFDLQKAFHKVSYKRLVHKLQGIGIGGKLLKWIKEWLRDRKQRVVLNVSFSDWRDVTSGVPQRSVLGPLLFIVYINDMESGILSRFWKFADDSKMVGRVNSEIEVDAIREDLNRLVEWTKRWKMPLNTTKCKVMHLGKKNPMTKYEIEGVRIPVTREEKDLGVIIHDSLKVESNFGKSVKKR